MSGACLIDGCSGTHEARGYCAKHYQRLKAHGAADGGKWHHYSDELTAFMVRVEPIPIAGCWIWTGGITDLGYGMFRFRGHRELAHRAAWRLLSGRPVSDGLQINHHCDVACCVNPAHLYEGTQADNVRDQYTHGGKRKCQT